jgi:ubiquinone/menaquinone biosynthesis C-methylase UbiE
MAGYIMNLLHSRQYKDIIKKIHESENVKDCSILDIGCGGGIAIYHLSKLFKKARLFGIDISEEMVRLARKLNKKGVAEGRINISLSEVSHMAIPDKTVRIITVFDCINFWQDYTIAFSEIKRVIQANGRIFIVNGYPEIGSKWYDFVKFKSVEDYRDLLVRNGFKMKKHEIIKRMVIIKGEIY